LRLIVPYILYN